MVKVVIVKLTVGVPEISPESLSKFKPFGSEGCMANISTAPPPRVGFNGVIAMSLVKVKGLPV